MDNNNNNNDNDNNNNNNNDNNDDKTKIKHTNKQNQTLVNPCVSYMCMPSCSIHKASFSAHHQDEHSNLQSNHPSPQKKIKNKK